MEQGVKHTIKENKSYFLTLTVEGWVDVFTGQAYRDLLIKALSFCIKEKGLNVYAYVIMSNHIHLIANSNEPFQLKDTIRDFKKFTSKACIQEMSSGVESRKEWMLNLFTQFGEKSDRHKNFKFWKKGNHAIELFNPRFTWQKVNYIHQNPVRAGLVSKPEDWLYSSASNYMEMESKLPEVIPIVPYLNF
ncbi:MAG: transposase [Cryomorphaceae bacterium]